MRSHHSKYIHERMLGGHALDVLSHRASNDLCLSIGWIDEVIERLIQRNANGDDVFKSFFLRKYRRRRSRKAAGAALLPNCVDIDKRHAHVKTPKQFRLWEGDTMSGKGHKGVVLSLTKHKTRQLVRVAYLDRESPLIYCAPIYEIDENTLGLSCG